MSKGILDKLNSPAGSLLTAFDGKTPPPVAEIDPGISLEKTLLSNYKGKTPPKYADNPPR
jgi:hypothetical protein